MKDLVITIAVVVAFCLAVVFVVSWVERNGCENIHDETGLPTKYVVTTCYVKVNGQWVPERNWRATGE